MALRGTKKTYLSALMLSAVRRTSLSASTGSSLVGTLAERTMQRRHWSILTARMSARDNGSPFRTVILGRFCRSFHSPEQRQRSQIAR